MVDSTRDRCPLRWAARDSERSCRPAPTASVASASISSWYIRCNASRTRSTPSAASRAASRSSRADWDRAIVCVSFASSLAGFHEASHDGPSTLRRQTRSYTTRRDVTEPRPLPADQPGSVRQVRRRGRCSLQGPDRGVRDLERTEHQAVLAPTPNPAAYTRLLAASYPTIKRADPRAVVIAGALAPAMPAATTTIDAVAFVDRMYRAGARRWLDAVSVHPYSFPRPPRRTPSTRAGHLPATRPDPGGHAQERRRPQEDLADRVRRPHRQRRCESGHRVAPGRHRRRRAASGPRSAVPRADVPVLRPGPQRDRTTRRTTSGC